MNFLFRKYYNYLNNIDIGLAICTRASSNTILDDNLVRFGVCMTGACPGIRKGGGPKSEILFFSFFLFCFSIFRGGAQLRKEMRK